MVYGLIPKSSQLVSSTAYSLSWHIAIWFFSVFGCFSARNLTRPQVPKSERFVLSNRISDASSVPCWRWRWRLGMMQTLQESLTRWTDLQLWTHNNAIWLVIHTFFIFHYGIILPIDFNLIFFKMVKTTNQITIWIWKSGAALLLMLYTISFPVISPNCRFTQLTAGQWGTLPQTMTVFSMGKWW